MHKVKWIDAGREPQCPPNPAYPDGVDIVATPAGAPSCKVDLPYPARRCGQYVVECTECGVLIALTTAGRPDDPRSVTFACKPSVHCNRGSGTSSPNTGIGCCAVITGNSAAAAVVVADDATRARQPDPGGQGVLVLGEPRRMLADVDGVLLVKREL